MGGTGNEASDARRCSGKQQAPQQALDAERLRERCLVPCWWEMIFPVLPALTVAAAHGDLEELADFAGLSSVRL